MRTDIDNLYKKCTRFDEGEYGRSGAYKEITGRKELLGALMVELFDGSIAPLLEEYTALLYDEMELEAQHFFEQGYFMKQD